MWVASTPSSMHWLGVSTHGGCSGGFHLLAIYRWHVPDKEGAQIYCLLVAQQLVGDLDTQWSS